MSNDPNKKKCPRLIFDIDRVANQILITARDQLLRKKLGHLLGHLYKDDDPNRKPLFSIASAHVKEEFMSCGVGTKMYERMAFEACKNNWPLFSDSLRSVYADNFWQKLLKKNKAICAIPANREKVSLEDYEDKNPLRPLYGRNGCERYKLVSCPPPLPLSGLFGSTKKRNRRKKIR